MACFSSLASIYLGVWWFAMFNIQFSVTGKFVVFLYLDAFLCLNECVISFNFCATFLWLLIMGHILKTLWIFWYWHLFISIGTAKHTTLIQLLVFLWSFFHPSRGIHWGYRKKVVWILRPPIHKHFQNIVAIKILGKSPVKHLFWSP